jgi:hypothetical protein
MEVSSWPHRDHLFCYKDLGGNGIRSNIQLPTSNMEDQPALGTDGKLLDASQIEWFHDPNDPHPMQPIAIPQGTISISFTSFQVGHGPVFFFRLTRTSGPEYQWCTTGLSYCGGETQ